MDAYLKATGDYAGLVCYRFYQCYRAMVRAKVNIIHSAQPGQSTQAVTQDASFQNPEHRARHVICCCVECGIGTIFPMRMAQVLIRQIERYTPLSQAEAPLAVVVDTAEPYAVSRLF